MLLSDAGDFDYDARNPRQSDSGRGQHHQSSQHRQHPSRHHEQQEPEEPSGRRYFWQGPQGSGSGSGPRSGRGRGGQSQPQSHRGQHDHHEQRDQRGQRDHHGQRDQRGQRDHHGQRDQRDQRDHHGQRDQSDQRDQHGQRDQRDQRESREQHQHQVYRPPHFGRYEPRNPSYRLSREDLRDIADQTLEALTNGYYILPGREQRPYDLGRKMLFTNRNTTYYAPDDAVMAAWVGDVEEGDASTQCVGAVLEKKAEDELEREEKAEVEAVDEQIKVDGQDSEVEKDSEDLEVAEKGPVNLKEPTPFYKTKVVVGEYSTLVGARRLHGAISAEDSITNKRIGVLNFASAKKPGGGFMNGAQAQEESIARASTLYPSLLTPAASTFYTHYAEDPDDAYYTHAMVYSPDVVLFRNDKGNWRKPVEVDVLTSAAVNAGEIRRELERQDSLRREEEIERRWRKRRQAEEEERKKRWAEQEAKMKKRREEKRLEREKEKEEKERKKFEKKKGKAPDEKELKSSDEVEAKGKMTEGEREWARSNRRREQNRMQRELEKEQEELERKEREQPNTSDVKMTEEEQEWARSNRRREQNRIQRQLEKEQEELERKEKEQPNTSDMKMSEEDEEWARSNKRREQNRIQRQLEKEQEELERKEKEQPNASDVKMTDEEEERARSNKRREHDANQRRLKKAQEVLERKEKLQQESNASLEKEIPELDKIMEDSDKWREEFRFLNQLQRDQRAWAEKEKEQANAEQVEEDGEEEEDDQPEKYPGEKEQRRQDRKEQRELEKAKKELLKTTDEVVQKSEELVEMGDKLEKATKQLEEAEDKGKGRETEMDVVPKDENARNDPEKEALAKDKTPSPLQSPTKQPSPTRAHVPAPAAPTPAPTQQHPLQRREKEETTEPDLRLALALSAAENQITNLMFERIARILHLFHVKRVPHIILGSFGTGVFQNRVELVAAIFGDLLVKKGGRFEGAFQTVMFAILGGGTVRVFEEVLVKEGKKAAADWVLEGGDAGRGRAAEVVMDEMREGSDDEGQDDLDDVLEEWMMTKERIAELEEMERQQPEGEVMDISADKRQDGGVTAGVEAEENGDEEEEEEEESDDDEDIQLGGWVDVKSDEAKHTQPPTEACDADGDVEMAEVKPSRKAKAQKEEGPTAPNETFPVSNRS